MTYSYLIFDAVIVGLLLLAVWRGYKKGFVLTLCGFLALFVAFIGATVVSNALAEPVARSIRPIVEQQIQQVLDEKASSAAAAAGETAAEHISIPLQEALDLLKDTKLYKGFADAFQKSVNDGMVAATANAARVISDYIARQVAQMLLFLVSFVLLLAAWYLISHALDLAFRLPVLSALNRWSGAALGLFRGGMFIFIACWLLKGSVLPQDAIQNSYLLKFFCTVSPLTLLF